MIQEMFLSVLSNAADRNRLPRRKIDVHGAQIRHLPTLSVCRDQRDTATVPSDIGQRHFGNKIAVWHIRKRLKRIVPKGDRRQRNFTRAFPNGIKCRIRINLDLFTRQNRSLPARHGCPADKFKARPFRNRLRQSECSERRACGREIGNGIGRVGRKDNFLCIRNIIGIYRSRFQYSSPCSTR